MRSGGSVLAAGRTVSTALIAFPRQIVAVVRTIGRSFGSADPSSGPANERRRSSGVARPMIGLPIALMANAAALVLVLSLGRAIYYPFWAAGASPAELERSWGGPSALGATLVHWLVAAVVVVASYLVILFAGRHAAERR